MWKLLHCPRAHPNPYNALWFAPKAHQVEAASNRKILAGSSTPCSFPAGSSVYVIPELIESVAFWIPCQKEGAPFWNDFKPLPTKNLKASRVLPSGKVFRKQLPIQGISARHTENSLWRVVLPEVDEVKPGAIGKRMWDLDVKILYSLQDVIALDFLKFRGRKTGVRHGDS